MTIGGDVFCYGLDLHATTYAVAISALKVFILKNAARRYSLSSAETVDLLQEDERIGNTAIWSLSPPTMNKVFNQRFSIRM